ncbi:MAG: lipoprotein-releasing ABC transporter permease subunit [Hyphomicrobiales bacterium]|nr:lipoprotein-releasing ABC transporter permease subunit [Hyphomicrobiales bacterium]
MADTAREPGAFSAYERMVSFRYLRARRKEGFISVITWFSFAGIMIGVATLIIVMAVMNGFRTELMGKILGFSGHANIYTSTAEPVQQFDTIIQRIKGVDGITQAIPYVEGQVLVSSRVASAGALIKGMREADLKALPSINNDKLRGTLDGFDESQGIIIGYRIGWQHRLSIGDNLTIVSPEGPDTIFGNAPRIRDYNVVGMFEIGMSEYDKSVIYMPLTEAQEYFDIGEGVSAIEVMVEDADKIEGYMNKLRRPEYQHLQFRTWKQSNQTLFNALQVERNVMFLILTMIILVAALNIISGLIMLVKDKSRDIAILRTIGASRGGIQRIFFMTGASIGIAGTLAGVVLGLIVCLNAESIRQFLSWVMGRVIFDPKIYYLSKLPIDIDPGETASVALMSIVLSFLATLYPSWRAARLDPVEALRYE